MAVSDFFDLFELLYYVFGFWLFLFSPDFRHRTIDRWKGRSAIQHIHTVFEVGLSTACGLLPVLLLWWLLMER